MGNKHDFKFPDYADYAVLQSEDPTWDGLKAQNSWLQFYHATKTMLGTQPPTSATIANGVLALTGCAYIVVDTEGGAASDNLETIPVTSTDVNGVEVDLCPDGAFILLKSADSSRKITMKHTPSINGGIQTRSGADTLLDSKDSILLRRSGAGWVEEGVLGLKLSDAVDLDSATIAASAKAVKTSYDASQAQASEFTGMVDGLRSDVPAMAAHAAMPGTQYINLPATPNTTLTYTPTTDGFVYIRLSTSVTGYAYVTQKINGRVIGSNSTIPANNAAMIYIPVLKNIPVEYELHGNVINNDYNVQFIPCQGAE